MTFIHKFDDTTISIFRFYFWRQGRVTSGTTQRGCTRSTSARVAWSRPGSVRLKPSSERQPGWAKLSSNQVSFNKVLYCLYVLRCDDICKHSRVVSRRRKNEELNPNQQTYPAPLYHASDRDTYVFRAFFFSRNYCITNTTARISIYLKTVL